MSAALASGPECSILSHDDFRQPAAIMPNEPGTVDHSLRASFRRWLASRHKIFLWWDENMKVPIVREPRRSVIGINHIERTTSNGREIVIHTPYKCSDDTIGSEKMNRKGGIDFRLAPTRVLCIRGLSQK